MTNAIDDVPMPIYGDGGALRDYMYVTDHCAGIDTVLHQGAVGEVYNVGGGNQINTIQLARAILARLGKPESLMEFVADRPGHDLRYSLDCYQAEGARLGAGVHVRDGAGGDGGLVRRRTRPGGVRSSPASTWSTTNATTGTVRRSCSGRPTGNGRRVGAR